MLSKAFLVALAGPPGLQTPWWGVKVAKLGVSLGGNVRPLTNTLGGMRATPHGCCEYVCMVAELTTFRWPNLDRLGRGRC